MQSRPILKNGTSRSASYGKRKITETGTSYMGLTIPTMSNDSLGQDMKAQVEALQREQEKREHYFIEYRFEAIINKVVDKSNEILESIAEKKNAKKSVLFIAANEICKAVDGELTVTNYSPRAKAEQDVYLFTGTHWIVLSHQYYFDFIRNCCDKMAITDDLIDDTSFQNELCERVARKISKERNPFIPSDEAWINMKNGTLVIHGDGSRELREHDREDFFTYCLDYEYDVNAECPLWQKFLDQMLPDAESQEMLAEYIGYCFTHNLNLEKMLVLYGNGSNGKSVVLDVIEALVGGRNVSNVGLADLTKDNEQRSQLENKLVNISHESDEELSTSVLKTIVSGEPVIVRQLYVGTHSMKNYAKLITSFNSLPKAEATHGFYRRFKILEFKVTIAESKADTDLAKKIIKELSGVMNWVLAALERLIKQRGFSPCKACDEALFKYKTQSNSAFLFFSQKCEISQMTTTHGTTLYKAYKEFCIEEGITFVGKNKFFDRFCQIEGVQRTESHRVIFFKVTLTNNGDAPF